MARSLFESLPHQTHKRAALIQQQNDDTLTGRRTILHEFADVHQNFDKLHEAFNTHAHKTVNIGLHVFWFRDLAPFLVFGLSSSVAKGLELKPLYLSVWILFRESCLVFFSLWNIWMVEHHTAHSNLSLICLQCLLNLMSHPQMILSLMDCVPPKWVQKVFIKLQA